MKKILATLLAAATLAGCYDEYVKDYDYSGVYIAYQYDLRTFVVGEGMKFTVGSVLAGVMDNERDRSVYYALDDELVTGDLAPFNGLDELGQPSAPFTAFDVMSGKSTSGTVSQSYVTTAVKASGIKELTPLPAGPAAEKHREGSRWQCRKLGCVSSNLPLRWRCAFSCIFCAGSRARRFTRQLRRCCACSPTPPTA